MDALLDPLTGDYTAARTDTLANAVYLRLATPLGAYWAAPSVGSRLHELAREKDVPRVALLARQYAEQALQALLNDGRATAISVTTERAEALGGTHRLNLLIEVTEASGRVSRFQHPVAVA